MKLIRFRDRDGTIRSGHIVDDVVVPLSIRGSVDEIASFADVLHEITVTGPASLDEGCRESTPVILDEVSIRPPIDRTSRLFCLGAVYTGHMREEGLDLAFDPNQWIMPPNAIIGHGETIVLPSRVAENVMPAAELCIVIGRQGKYIDPMEAFDHVAGYTISNDVTARTDWPGPMGYKMMDTFSPIGPHVVTTDEVDNPMNLMIEMRQDGREICQGNTTGMRFTISFLISYLSAITRLRPGDVISAGDPGGVTERLKPGSTVEIEIESVGTLINDVRRE